jgi:PAS domain S-box-containing protein
MDKQTEAPTGLQPDENLYRLLAGNFPNGSVFLFGHDLRYTLADGPGIAAMGFTQEQFIGKRLRDIFPPEVYERDEPALYAALAGQTTTVEVGYGGRHFWVQTLPIRDDLGDIVGGMVLTQDITELKQTQIIERERNRFNAMIANIPVMIFRFRNPKTFEYISPRCLELNGIEAETARQNPALLIDQILPEDRVSFDQVFQEAMRNQQAYTWEGRVTVRGEERWRRLEASPSVEEDGGVVWNGVQTDITLEKRAEAALMERERLETILQKELELGLLKTRMMQRLSHEFRTPLALVMTATSMLERYYTRLTELQRVEYLEQIEGQVMQLTGILEEIDLVVQGLFQTLPFEPRLIDMGEIIREEVNNLKVNFRTTAPIAVSRPDDVPQIMGDRDQIHAILWNLLSNAIKFGSSGKSVSVDLSVNDDYVIIGVRDEGMGIPPEDQERLFEPFYRGTNIGEIPGLGLGLSIVKKAVDLHGGTIHIESTVGEGTTITVKLPLPAP